MAIGGKEAGAGDKNAAVKANSSETQEGPRMNSAGNSTRDAKPETIT